MDLPLRSHQDRFSTIYNHNARQYQLECETRPDHRAGDARRREIRQGPGNVFPGQGRQRWAEGRVAELERKIGQQALEIDFLKGCLQRIEEQRMLQALTGNPRSTGRSKKK